MPPVTAHDVAETFLLEAMLLSPLAYLLDYVGLPAWPVVGIAVWFGVGNAMYWRRVRSHSGERTSAK